MLKFKSKRKFSALPLVVALGLLLSTNLQAQDRPGGLFGSHSLSETNNGLFGNTRDMNEIEGEILNEDFDETLPLGNGILIFVTASAGYALLKSKEDKK